VEGAALAQLELDGHLCGHAQRHEQARFISCKLFVESLARLIADIPRTLAPQSRSIRPHQE
jgi:hypothetical protein